MTYSRSDVDIFLLEEYSVVKSREVVGVVCLPLTRYMGVTQPTPPKVEWFQFIPYSEVVSDDAKETDSAGLLPPVIFHSGDSHIPGSAMTKSKHALGFVCVQVELYVTEPAYKLFLKSKYPANILSRESEVCLYVALSLIL